MPNLIQDEKELLARLERLPNRLRAVFAAACAERQLPNYLPYSMKDPQRNPDALARLLNRLWADLEGNQVADADLQQDLDKCMSLLPAEDSTDYTAEDAVSAVAYAISTRLDAGCPPSALVRQNSRIEEGRISGSS
jgi:uncharacterized protein YjaG (DUF416 family)